MAPLLPRYKKAVAVIATVLFFTGTTVYVDRVRLLPFSPMAWAMCIGTLALPTMFSGRTTGTVRKSGLVPWILGYWMVSTAGFFASSQSDLALQELRLRTFSCAFLLLMLILFSDRRVHRAVRWSVLFSVLLAVGLNVVDLLAPMTFSVSLGRSAGLYGNPNIAGSALVAGMILSIDLVGAWRRHVLAVLVGLGVFLTLSRGAMVAYVVVVGLLALPDRFEPRRLSGIAFAAGICVIMAGVSLATGKPLTEAVTTNIEHLDRLSVLDPAREDGSIDERATVARRAWEMFQERPITGYGTGSTNEWSYTQSAHNIYLKHMAEHGLVGLLIFPSLLYAIVRRSPPHLRRLALTFAVFLAIWGTVSHNVIEEVHLLVGVALIGSMLGAERRSASSWMSTSVTGRPSILGISPIQVPNRDLQ